MGVHRTYVRQLSLFGSGLPRCFRLSGRLVPGPDVPDAADSVSCQSPVRGCSNPNPVSVGPHEVVRLEVLRLGSAPSLPRYHETQVLI
jgi:hypothetical protein